MVQNNEKENMPIDRKRLTKKQFKELIKAFGAKLDSEFTKTSFNATYILRNGQVAVDFDTHAFLYNSFSELKKWMAHLYDGRSNNSIGHILKNRMIYGADYCNHSVELVQKANSFFKIENNTPSMEGIKVIDSFINLNKTKFVCTSELFSSLVSYVGQVIKTEVRGSDWKLIRSKTDGTIWEPYVILGSNVYNPFMPVYREIFEELPETNAISLWERVSIELNSH